MKMDAFKTAKKVNKYLGYFCKKICHQELSKIDKSGHTTNDDWVLDAIKRLRAVLNA